MEYVYLIEIDIQKKSPNMDIKLSIDRYEFVALSGISGSGKTTLLRILAGLEEAKGQIKVDNKVWLSSNIFLPPQKRNIGFVFQDYALFDNMSVKDNLLYISNDKELANHLLSITHLDRFADSYPQNLSGGQKQRVSLCRAIMNKPQILLLDEPLSALDIDMRDKLQNEILLLHKEFKMTTIMVSHNQNEIYRLANRIIYIDNGKIVDSSTTIQNIQLEGKIISLSDTKNIFKKGDMLKLVINGSEVLVEIVAPTN